MNRNSQLAVRCLTTVFMLFAVLGAVNLAYAQAAPSDCIGCHSDVVNEHDYALSSHKNLACTVCHLVDPNKPAPTKDDKSCVAGFSGIECAVCHSKIDDQYEKSAHNSKRLPVPCWKCHADIHSLQSHKDDRERSVEVCAGCHKWQHSYFQSVHYSEPGKGSKDTPTCADCHGVHDIAKIENNAAGREFSTQACLKCHDNAEMMKRNNVALIAGQTFFNSLHGKQVKLGFPERVAGCADCHTAHDVRKADDPASSINTAHLEQTCGKCHVGANANFVKFQPHACHCDPEKYPILYWTFIFMTALLLGTLVFFWTHTLLWWRKTYWEKRNLCNEGGVVDPRMADITMPAQCYWRFTPLARIMHVILLSSFFALVLTGMPLRFSDVKFASPIIHFFGGAHTAGIIHRIAATILITLFAGTVVMSIRFLLNKKNGATFKDRLFSPDSMFPRLKDWEDFKGMVRWFFNRGPEPEFDRWTYWEKFDFLAVFWGMTAIGLSGALLWLPEATAKLLPGWLFNVALIIHSDEALLATGFIFTVHFFNTHLIPTKFPMDAVIFTGRVRKWQFIREKPLYWKRLEEAGKLESIRATQPSIYVLLASGIIGYSALLLGLGIMALAFIEIVL